jgi:uncharacterized protein YjbK
MTQEIEIEYKNLLTRAEFERLSKAYGLTPEDFVLQHNDYFDTVDFQLKKRGAALRIREKENEFVLTLKEPNAVGLLETHQRLTERETRQMLLGEAPRDGEVIARLSHMGVRPSALRHFGRLSTKRAEVALKEGVLVLDHSMYGAREDFELEFEAADAAAGWTAFHAILRQHGIPRRPAENKIRRMMKSIYSEEASAHGDQSAND